MLKVLQGNQRHQGRPSKLSLADQLLMSLSYWRESRTLFHVGMSDGVSEPSASRIIRAVENQLIQLGLFSLPKKRPQGQSVDWEVVIVDATDIEIEHPQKKQRHYYSTKHKAYTLKAQVVVHDCTRQILSTAMTLSS